MIHPNARRSALAVAFLAGLSLLFALQRDPAGSPAPGQPLLTSYLPAAARPGPSLAFTPDPVVGHALVYNPVRGRTITLEALTVRAGERVLYAEGLDQPLPGDPRYGELQTAIERLPEELSHRHAERRFAAPDAPTFSLDEAPDQLLAIQRDVAALRARHASGVTPAVIELDYEVDWNDLFTSDDRAGTQRTLTIEVSWRDPSGARSLLTTTSSVELLAPLARATELPGLGPISIHAGDLHVHSCKGEATGACAPFENCAAETLQLSGAFTYAELKSQYQALGYEWFAATDHSYCVDADSEYQLIVDECAALTDANFFLYPHLELSSDESGPQIGSDIGDLACFGTTSSNHMGAHGITARKEGGESSFQGFCDGLFGSDALASFPSNIAAVRAEGGWPIINHATGSFAWNSFEATGGIEANAAQGCEIWNGATSTGQGGDVERWVDWLLAGRLLYAYGGSDTHDEAIVFGANHAVLVGQPFTQANVEAALRQGRSYVSDQHMLILEAVEDGVAILMGSIQGLAPASAAPQPTINVHYDFGQDSGTIEVFAGRAGDAAESLLCQSATLTGSGVFTCQATLDPSARSWIRAYSSGGGHAAYTNPIFWAPTTCAPSAFGAGFGGANVGTLSSSSGTSLGGVATFSVSGFSSASTQAQLYFALAPFPSGVPLLGGGLLLTPPINRIATGALSAGQAALPVSLPLEPNLAGASVYLQAVAIDPGQGFGVGFTNGLQVDLCLPGQ